MEPSSNLLNHNQALSSIVSLNSAKNCFVVGFHFSFTFLQYLANAFKHTSATILLFLIQRIQKLLWFRQIIFYCRKNLQTLFPNTHPQPHKYIRIKCIETKEKSGTREYCMYVQKEEKYCFNAFGFISVGQLFLCCQIIAFE